MNPHWVESSSAAAVAVIVTVFAMGMSFYNIMKHAVYYNSPRTQKYIFRILGIIPVYALSSCISIIFSDVSVIILTIRDMYEAFVVYAFFTLILEYAGGDYNCSERMKHLPPVSHPPPLCFLSPVRRDAYLLRLTKQGVVQFVVIKPIMAIAGLVALAGGFYFDDIFQVILLVVYNVTYSVALYCLLIFYLAIQSLLTPFQPVQKFFAVKAIVFATFWQSMIVFFIPSLSAEEALAWNNFLLCIESVPFAWLLNRAFPYHDFITATTDKRVASESVKQMMNVGDVFQDAYHSFMPSYQDYVVARDDHDNPKTVRAKTFLVGNLDSEAMKGANGHPHLEEGTKVPQSGDSAGASGNVGQCAERGRSETLGEDDLGIDENWSASDVHIIEMPHR